MKTRLTLTIQKDIIITAKKYAAKNGNSLSGLVENYLKTLRVNEKKEIPEFSARVKRMKGILSLPDNFDYKETAAKEMLKKYQGI